MTKPSPQFVRSAVFSALAMAAFAIASPAFLATGGDQADPAVAASESSAPAATAGLLLR